MAMLCLNSGAKAQELKSELKPLKVGDKLPETFWQQEHTLYDNGQTTKQTLAPYKRKLLILDFWATWCGSCIKKFALSDSLHQAYGEQVKVLLINTSSTKDTPTKIAATMATYGKNSLSGP